MFPECKGFVQIGLSKWGSCLGQSLGLSMLFCHASWKSGRKCFGIRETFMYSLVFSGLWLMQSVSLFQCVGKYATRVDARTGQIHC